MKTKLKDDDNSFSFSEVVCGVENAIPEKIAFV